MKQKLIFIGGILVLAGISFITYQLLVPLEEKKGEYSETSTTLEKNGTEENTESAGTPTFVWSYEEADFLSLDGLPETEVILTATYADETVETKLIDTVSGDCNDLPDSDADSVPGTKNAQCYYAGLGYVFKITEGETAYLVKRKTFEEALPNYEPPAYEYEVVAEFPL